MTIQHSLNILRHSCSLDRITGIGADVATSAKGIENPLIVATNAEFEPFEYKVGGNFCGIDMEVAKLLADYLGKTLVVMDMDFDSVQSGLRFEPNCTGELKRGKSNKEFLWVPEENWSLEEEYRVVVSAEVQDGAGVSLAARTSASTSSVLLPYVSLPWMRENVTSRPSALTSMDFTVVMFTLKGYSAIQ